MQFERIMETQCLKLEVILNIQIHQNFWRLPCSSFKSKVSDQLEKEKCFKSQNYVRSNLKPQISLSLFLFFKLIKEHTFLIVIRSKTKVVQDSSLSNFILNFTYIIFECNIFNFVQCVTSDYDPNGGGGGCSEEEPYTCRDPRIDPYVLKREPFRNTPF